MPLVGSVASIWVALVGLIDAIVFTTVPVRSSSSTLTGSRKFEPWIWPASRGRLAA